jgi:hypothetical protein
MFRLHLNICFQVLSIFFLGNKKGNDGLFDSFFVDKV